MFVVGLFLVRFPYLSLLKVLLFWILIIYDCPKKKNEKDNNNNIVSMHIPAKTG